MATTYAIHSTVRGRHNRSQRAAQPVHHRFKQHLGDSQRRLIRGRPLLLPEEEFLRALPEIKAKAALGVLEVRTVDGVRVDLETLQPLAPPAATPLPAPPLDSIADDKPWGETIPRFAGDELAPSVDPNQEPALLADLDAIDEDEDGGEPAPASAATSPTEPSPARTGKARKAKR